MTELRSDIAHNLTLEDKVDVQIDLLRKIEFHLSMMTDEKLVEPDTGEI